MTPFTPAGRKAGRTALSCRRALVAAGLLAAIALPTSWAQSPAATPAHSGVAPAASGQPIKLALIESLSGPFANTGEAVYRNIFWAIERVNARGGVALPAAAGGARSLQLQRYDSKGQNEEALSALRAAGLDLDA